MRPGNPRPWLAGFQERGDIKKDWSGLRHPGNSRLMGADWKVGNWGSTYGHVLHTTPPSDSVAHKLAIGIAKFLAAVVTVTAMSL